MLRMNECSSVAGNKKHDAHHEAREGFSRF
jgi:hypothetical protein